MNTEILIKYIEGNATEQEIISIVEWLDSDPENMREFLALRKLHDITIWQTPLSENGVQIPKARINEVSFY